MKVKTQIEIMLLMLALCNSVSAHKVNIFAYVEGDTVYIKSCFSNGRKVEDGKVEVYDTHGNKLLEGRTDKDGQFKFKLPKRDDLKVILTDSMGHKASCTILKDELMTQRVPKPKKPSYIDLNKEVPFADIIAGIGYILGTFGIILYFMSRKGRRKDASTKSG
jgi:nickel transport protein